MAKYFGTDGIRGIAGRELTAELAERVGRSFGAFIRQSQTRKCEKSKSEKATDMQRKVVIIGKDTRISSDMLELAVASGLAAAGIDVQLAGVIPTSALSYLVTYGGYSAGIMISASHNPYYDNGIKLLGEDGAKLREDEEEAIERLIDSDTRESATHDRIGRISPLPDASEKYISHITSLSDARLEGLRIALDTANGAASGLAGEIFRSLGAEVTEIAASPNGTNIGEGVGSTHPDLVSRLVRELSLDAGFAFDGDADRCIAVGGSGEVLDGDKLAYIIASDLSRKGELHENTVVLTVMSNSGLIAALARLGIRAEITPVGDRFIADRMREGDLSLGSEQSGHLIMSKYSDTGDGIITALRLAEILKRGTPLEELATPYTPMPQYTLNLPLANKEVADLPEVRETCARLRDKRRGVGKLIIRKSGTEPLVRITVEAESEDICRALAEEIGEKIKEVAGRYENK